MKKHKTMGIIALVLLMVFILCVENHIVLNVALGYPKPKEVEIEEYLQKSNTEVKYDLNGTDTVYSGGIQERYDIVGYACCESNYSQQKRTVEILLRGRNTCYSIPTETGYTEEVSGIDLEKRDNKNIAVITKFSLIQIEDDVYDIYVYVEENEHNYGLVKSNFSFAREKGKYMSIDDYNKLNI